MLLFENVAVTSVASSASPTLAGCTDRLTSGAVSSSIRVRLTPSTGFTVRSAFVPDTVMVSLTSTKVSLVGVRVKVALPLLLPASMVTSKPVTAA